MRVLVTGATGMVGQGVLRECLLDERVTEVVAVGRHATGVQHPKLHEVVTAELSTVGESLRAADACFFCLGVSSVGMTEADYRRITYDLTLDLARPLAAANPDMTFIYVSGAGTDSTEQGSRMWSRVKGETENAVIALPFHGYAMRPGFIQPRHGVRSRVGWYRAAYTVLWPLGAALVRFAPGAATTSERLGRAMLQVALAGSPKQVLESRDINALSALYAPGH